jgi:hypothetical protein
MGKAKNISCLIILLIFSFISIYGQELDDKLKLLEPFINTRWEAKEPRFGDEGKIEMNFEIIENGKVIKRTDTIKAINSTSVYLYFWDFNKQEIGVFGIHNNGNFVNGHVKEEEDGKIMVYGHGIFPNLKLEFRNTYELSDDGKFTDNYFRYEDGKWKPGHSRVYYLIK